MESLFLSPVLQFEFEYFPRKYELLGDNIATQTSAPNVWLMANIGVSFQSLF
jgi:hypothetical protein